MSKQSKRASDAEPQYPEEELMRKSMEALFPGGAPLCASVSVCTRFNNIMGITSCCYNALKLYLLRYICNKIYPGSAYNAAMKITENQLYELISTSINFGSILNIVPGQGTQSLGDAIRSGSSDHRVDDKLIRNMQWCYEAFTSQFGGERDKIIHYAYEYNPQAGSSELTDVVIDAMVQNMFVRSWSGPIPFVLMCRDEPDHWFAIHCGHIISTWGIGDKGVDIKFDARRTTPEQFADFIKNIKNAKNSADALLSFKEYLKTTMLNSDNARNAATTLDKINKYVEFYENPLKEGRFDVCEIFDTATGISVETKIKSIYDDLRTCELLLAPSASETQPQDTQLFLKRTKTFVPREQLKTTVEPHETRTSSIIFGATLFNPRSRNALLQPIAGVEYCTRRQGEKISNCGITISCNLVKTLFLIFSAMGTLGRLNADEADVIIGGINKLLYTTIDLSLLRVDGNNQAVQGSLYSQIRERLGDGTDDFIRRLEFLQEFTKINIPQPKEYFVSKGLQPVSLSEHGSPNNFDGEDGIGEKILDGKEYFILCSFNTTTGLLNAEHYFICGKSESESASSSSPVVKIYSAWSSDNVKNTYSTTQVSYNDFRNFAKAIETQKPGQEPGQEPRGFRAFLMATMLNPDNEQFGTQTLKQIEGSATAQAQRADATRRINTEIDKILQRNLLLCTVPNYLTILTRFISDGRNRGVFNLFGISHCIATAAEGETTMGTSADAAYPYEPAGSSEEYGGARPKRNKITRRIRRHNRGKTMKRPRANKRRANKVQTKKIIKRKKPKSTNQSMRRHIVKK